VDAGAVPELSAKGIDFGGCRCQACAAYRKRWQTLIAVCEFSPNRAVVDAALREINSSGNNARDWTYRVNPSGLTY